MKKFTTVLAVIFTIFIGTSVNAQKKTEQNVEFEFRKDKVIYQPVDVSQLPQPVISAVKNDFSAEVISAQVNQYEEFKLQIRTTEATTRTVYANAEGAWIKPTE
ncbi:hypothetical protein [Mesonia aestuariivivens]|uniref:DUF4968 domain-containing protein n=1 Tax=Mesonia aestuariivivens TaxID=2796128 RepID=A0ABS6VYP4_9FLAO|nr:hypothetical protein [Mesonia aestuariivivens]MBW2960386.1 hypothetical protein [Mesonia aestuariivivens]